MNCCLKGRIKLIWNPRSELFGTNLKAHKADLQIYYKKLSSLHHFRQSLIGKIKLIWNLRLELKVIRTQGYYKNNFRN